MPERAAKHPRQKGVIQQISDRAAEGRPRPSRP